MVIVNINQDGHVVFRNIIDDLIRCYNIVKDKIKSTFHNKMDFDIFDYFKEKLNSIANNLESIPYCQNEFDDFLEIRSYTLYILHKYFKNPNFGHIDDIIHLLNLFKSIIEEKFNLFKEFSDDNKKDYETKYSKFSKKLSSYDDYFLLNVYESDLDCIKDVERFSKSLRDD